MLWSIMSKKMNLVPLFQKVPLVPPTITRLGTGALLSTYRGGEILGSSHYSGTPFSGFLLGKNCRMGPSFICTRFSSFTPWRIGKLPTSGFKRGYISQAAQQKKSQTTLLYLTGVVCTMVACTYASVPLYRRFCQATGYGGTVQRKESVEEKIARHAQDGTVTARELVVQFNADVADGMPWKFTPTQREVRVKPGESALAFYTAENHSSTPITGVSTYNVTPMKAAIYFNKIQCFCFEEQRLLPGEQIDMPVFFYIDPEFETDPRMDGINNLILSYTFFKVNED